MDSIETHIALGFDFGVGEKHLQDMASEGILVLFVRGMNSSHFEYSKNFLFEV